VCDDLARVEASVEKTVDLTAKIAELEARLAELEPAEGDEPRLQTQRTRSPTADGRLPMLERTLDAIRTHDPKKGCVLDAGIPCKTATTHFAGQVSKLEQQVMTLKAEKDSATEALTAQKKPRPSGRASSANCVISTIGTPAATSYASARPS
jgi:hypothetical protein